MQPDADLIALERALVACRPVADGLNADAMLFAAGRASAKRGWVWPTTTAAFAFLSVGLGMALSVERAERAMLEARLQMPSPTVIEPSPGPAAGTFAFRRDFDADALYVLAPSSGPAPALSDNAMRGWPVRAIEP